jgi:predicted enzyme related to lactoylglutathione lyase
VPRPVHFDIAADDPQRAIGFYTDAFGWRFHQWDGPMEYWLVATGSDDEPGIDGGLARRRDGDQPITATIDVASLDEYVGRIEAAGGTILQPKSPVPGVGWLAMFADTEGNVFGLMEADETAGTSGGA